MNPQQAELDKIIDLLQKIVTLLEAAVPAKSPDNYYEYKQDVYRCAHQWNWSSSGGVYCVLCGAIQ